MNKLTIGIGILLVIAAVLVGGWFYISSNPATMLGQSNTPTESPSEADGIDAIDADTENEVVAETSKLTVAETEVEPNETESDLETNDEQDESTEEIEEGSSMVSTGNEAASTEARATAVVAGGCFWCVESDLEKLQGVLDVVSGYMGGTNDNPTYKNYDDNGHKEVVLVTYNPTVVSYREIAIYAIKHMDPTDGEGSFYDRGVEYGPALYYETSFERGTANEVIKTIDNLGVYEDPLAIEALERSTFWPAEEYHQDYYKKNTLKYKFYRTGSGRDAFIKTVWGDDTDATLPGETTPFDVSTWQNFVKPSEEVLASTLTEQQYKITQKNGTERSFSNEYWDNKEEGIYVDVVSGEPLYSSTDKFDSGTGWPSFTKGIYPDAVTEHADYKLIVPRTEVRSQFADSHLGHVFNDAPPELGGIRHCINSAALRFVPVADMEAEGYGQFLTLFN